MKFCLSFWLNLRCDVYVYLCVCVCVYLLLSYRLLLTTTNNVTVQVADVKCYAVEMLLIFGVIILISNTFIKSAFEPETAL